MKNNLKKNFIWNSIGSTLNACVSLFLMIIVTRINGVDDAGVFTFAYSLACLLQVLTTYAGRPYQVTEMNKEISDSDFFWSRIFTTILTFIVASIYIYIKGYTIYKIIIILLALTYRVSDAISDCFYAIMQKKEILHKVGKSLLIKGLVGSIVFIIIDVISKNIIFSLTILTITNILICYLYDYLNVKKIGFKINKIDKEKVKMILKGGFSVFAFTILIQYLVSAQKYTIDATLEDSFQTIFGIILMPATVIVLISQFIVQPYLTTVTDLIKNKNYTDLQLLIKKMMIYIILFSLVSIIGAYLIGTQVLSIVYGISLIDYRLPLTLILLGASLFALSYVLSSVMTAFRFNNQQLYIYIIVSIFTYFESIYFVKNYEIFGASMAYLVSMILLLILYLVLYFIIKKGFDLNEKSIDNSSSL